ncbi:MAG: hypothetical protein ACE366_00795 [Bradymonadia bacterium]
MKTQAEIDLARRLDDYLDGRLSHEETRITERLLIEPEIADALAEAIALRELLSHVAEQLSPPEGLDDRIIAALGVEEEAEVLDLTEAPAGGWVRGLFATAGMMVQGSRSGVSNMGYALASFSFWPSKEKPPRRPLWRRALSFAGRQG